jgi:phenylalanine-4-hydroxylase
MTTRPNGQPNTDYVIDQGFSDYTAAHHAVWQDLFMRQSRLLPGRACTEFIDGLSSLGVVANEIPNFDVLSAILTRATGWSVVAVPGLVPDDVFFHHLSERRFPATNWIRRRDQMDYLQEPDVFHDVFGHVPLLMNPVFADYLQAYGRGGLKALRLNALPLLARLYWYTVEFGLIKTEDGLRIYGSGIVSSFSETRYCLENSTPLRLGFDTARIMRTRYRIDDFQETYFVIDSFDQLFDATAPDFAPLYRHVASQPEINPGAAVSNDRMIALVAQQ